MVERSVRDRSAFAALLVLLSLSGAGPAHSQAPAPPAPQPATPAPPQVAPAPAPPAPAPAPPPNPVSFIRNKIAAGDLLSAESILEEHKAANGEDPAYLSGLAWLARGALLLGDLDKAKRHASDVRERSAAALAKGATLQEDHALEIALGAALEVEAQLLERRSGPRKAAEFLRAELAKLPGPVALRSRLNKRIHIMTLAGSPAPEIVAEDAVGERPAALSPLAGKPVVLFLWAEWCGDCKAQARSLAAVRKRHPEVQFIALTRYYDDVEKRAAEKERVAEAWRTVYADVGTIPVVISAASMERYGGSSTPTFVFIDRTGVVRRYTPTRLTEAELDRAVQAIRR